MINISVITNYGNKTVDINYINGTLVNTINNNEVISLPYNSYILYLSNPVTNSSITNTLNYLDDTFISLFMFTFVIILIIVFYTFIQIIKRNGFK